MTMMNIVKSIVGAALALAFGALGAGQGLYSLHGLAFPQPSEIYSMTLLGFGAFAQYAVPAVILIGATSWLWQRNINPRLRGTVLWIAVPLLFYVIEFAIGAIYTRGVGHVPSV